VHEPRGHAEGVQRVTQVARVLDRHAEGDRAPIPGELLDRAGHEGIALLDVHGLRQLFFGEVEAFAGEPRQVRVRGDAIAAEPHQVTLLDEVGQRARIGDLLEHPVEPLPVAALRGGGEAEERAIPARREGAQAAQHAEVVLGRRVVALVVDHEAEIAALEQPLQALLVERADRSNDHLRLGGGPTLALLQRYEGLSLSVLPRAPQRVLDLLPGLGQELFPVREHQHVAPGEARKSREDDRLAGARGQTDQQTPEARAPRGEHRVDGLLLVRAQRGSHYLQ
jgi:hypothetical protein